MAFKMKNPSMAKMVKAAGDNRAAMKMKMEAAAKMKAKSAMKMKSPMEKELVGKQHNLPPELKAKIEAAPSKMKKSAMKMKKDSAMKRAGYYEYDIDGNKKQITSDEFKKKREKIGATLTAGKADDKGKPGEIVADMSHGYSEIEESAEKGNPISQEIKKDAGYRKSVSEGMKPRGQRGTHVKTTRYAEDQKKQAEFDKKNRKTGDKKSPTTMKKSAMKRKSHADRMAAIEKRGQKKIDRITGKAKEDRKAKRAQNKITRAGERGQAKDDRKRLADARKASRAAASESRATRRIDRKSTKLQAKEDRTIARADKRIAKQQAKKQNAMDKNYKKMKKLVR